MNLVSRVTTSTSSSMSSSYPTKQSKQSSHEEISEGEEDMSDHTESSSDSMSMKDDDSMASLDGAIPSMAQYYGDDDDEEEEEEEDAPSIHYMGREYKADQFRNSAQVLSQSTIGAHRRTRDTFNDRWSQFEGQVLSSQSEHWGNSRRNNNNSPCRRSPKRGSVAARGSISPKPRSSRRASSCMATPNLAPPPFGRQQSSGPKSNPPKTRMVSQSEHFGSTRRRASISTAAMGTNDMSRSGHNSMSRSTDFHQFGPSTAGRRASTAFEAVGKFISNHYYYDNNKSSQAKKTERWQHSLNRWGYTNHDVLGIVEDQQIFAKLQSDLRQHQAVTNNVIQQKIHVFVHNTKSRRHTLAAMAAPTGNGPNSGSGPAHH